MRNPSKPAILRLGPIQPEELRQVLGTEIEDRSTPPENTPDDTQEMKLSPGRLKQHYSPHAEVHLIEHGITCENLAKRSNTAVLLNQRPSTKEEIAEDIFWLSEDGDMSTVASNLFGMLQKLDRQGYLRIAVELCPEEGIGRAINDRLNRSSAKD